MIRYRAKYVDALGAIRTRTCWAPHSRDVRQDVNRQGGRVLRITNAATRWNPRRESHLSLNRSSAIALMDQLSMQLKAGIALDAAVATLAREGDCEIAQRMMAGVFRELRRSGQVAPAFAVYRRQFSPHVIRMIEVGHRTGKLSETFASIARYWAEVDEIRAVARKALTYPAIATLVLLGVSVFLFGFVLPTFGRVFTELGLQVPGLTRFYLNLSSYLIDHFVFWCLFGCGIAILGALAFRWLPWRRRVDCLAACLPGLKALVQAIAVTRLTSNLSILNEAGVPIQESMRVCLNTTGNAYYDEAVEEAVRGIQRGDSLSYALDRTGRFPPLVGTCLRVGEVSNRLGDALGRVRDYYSTNARTLLQSRLQWLEPMLTLGLGLFVGSVAVSLFHPIISLAMSVRS